MCGYHVYSDAPGISVLGGGDGLVQPLHAGVGTVEYSGGGLLCEHVGGSIGDGHAGDFQHRPGGTVHQRGVHGATGEGGSAGQHGRTRPGDGQSVHRAVVEELEV